MTFINIVFLLPISSRAKFYQTPPFAAVELYTGKFKSRVFYFFFGKLPPETLDNSEHLKNIISRHFEITCIVLCL